MWSPDPVRQRLAAYTIEDVLALPGDAPRVELRDGVMIVVPSPTFDHQDIQFLLQRWLRDNTPGDFRVSAGVGVAVELNQTFEPDVLLVRRDVNGGSHYAMADQVVLAVEIVSPGTKRRDRIEKPADYAAADIPFFWRIEQNPVHVYAYELATNGSYTLVADSDTELILERPFEIRLPIGDITP
jgi:Uma2 family endonuclease